MSTKLAAILPSWAVVVLAVAGLTGFGIRCAYVFDPDPHFLRESPVSEDAYYAFSVSRNLAAGRGMTADGENLTNGFQPLSTFVGALFYIGDPDDELLGVRGFMVFSLALTVITATLLAALARRMTGSGVAGIAAACLYLAHPLSVTNDLNGLDTGCATTLLAGSLMAYLKLRPSQPDGPARRFVFGVGACLGLLCLARIDCVVGVCILAALHTLHGKMAHLGRRLRDALGFSLVAAAILSPWLVSNVVNFGSLMPISGQASRNPITPGTDGVFPQGPDVASNVVEAARHVVDTPLLFPIGKLLNRLPASPALQGVFLVAMALAGVLLLRRHLSARPPDGGAERVVVLFVALNLAVFAAMYTVMFGSASWFMGRYLHPANVAAGPVVLTVFLTLTGGAFPRRLVAAGLVLVAVFLAGDAVRGFQGPNNQSNYDLAMHLRSRYPDLAIGMFQSGTTGYFCPNVKNLDGKVNPEVHPYFETGRLADYVNDVDLDAVVDWPRIADVFMRDPVLAGRFSGTDYGEWRIYLRDR